ncbi:hypothetical protein BH24BAC1_BH24BAC1_21260 [soil metagenome]
MQRENPLVTEYLNRAPTEQKEIMSAIRQLIRDSVPDVKEEFKWSRPVFKGEKDFAYLKREKAYVTLGFYNFQKLKDEQNRLEGTGKEMRHVKLKTKQDIDRKLFEAWFKTGAA